MGESYPVVVGAGTLCLDDGVAMTHPWTGAGVTFEAELSGAHVLHLAVATCVLNDVYREADRLGQHLSGVQVTAEGGFDDDWRSTGIRYTIAVDSALEETQVTRLLERVDETAEIPRALRHGTSVTRVGHA
jgi:uncharacterized OsmC-like protein